MIVVGIGMWFGVMEFANWIFGYYGVDFALGFGNLDMVIVMVMIMIMIMIMLTVYLYIWEFRNLVFLILTWKIKMHDFISSPPPVLHHDD